MSELESVVDNVKEDEVLPAGDFNFILGQPNSSERWVEIPEWNCKVKIKSLTKAEQVKLRKASMVRGNVDDLRLEMNLISFSLVEPRLTLDQVDELYAKSNPKALMRLQAACLTFSGLTEDYIKQAEEDFR